MRLKDLEQVKELRGDLERADRVLAEFEKYPGSSVPAFAVAGGAFREVYAEILPVDKAVAVSAARRSREKVAAKLRELGVEVDCS